jgi:hypothetical protein
MVPRFPRFPHPRQSGTEFWVSPLLCTLDCRPMRPKGFPFPHLPAFPVACSSMRLDLSSRSLRLPRHCLGFRWPGFPAPLPSARAAGGFPGFPESLTLRRCQLLPAWVSPCSFSWLPVIRCLRVSPRGVSCGVSGDRSSGFPEPCVRPRRRCSSGFPRCRIFRLCCLWCLPGFPFVLPRQRADDDSPSLRTLHPRTSRG